MPILTTLSSFAEKLHFENISDDVAPGLMYSSTGTSSIDEFDALEDSYFSSDSTFKRMLLDQHIIHADESIEELEELMCKVSNRSLKNTRKGEESNKSIQNLMTKGRRVIDTVRNLIEKKKQDDEDSIQYLVKQDDIDEVAKSIQSLLDLHDQFETETNQMNPRSPSDTIYADENSSFNAEDEQFQNIVLRAQAKLVKTDDSSCNDSFSNLLESQMSFLVDAIGKRDDITPQGRKRKQ